MKKHISIVLLQALSMSVAAQAVHEHSICEDDSINPMKEAILSEVTVNGLTGIERLKDSPIPFTVISPHKLHVGSGTNIVDIIAREPGVSQISTGAGISKPIIRGLGYNRVVVVDQGIRQEGQQWGDEHGLEVDAEGVHSVEILKGPASLMYGSDAIAGVMVLHPDHPLLVNTIQAKVGGVVQSNNGMYNYHTGFAGNINGWLWNWHFNDKAAHCYKNARDGYVPGAWYKEHDILGMIGLQKRWGHSLLRFSLVDFTPGITEGERDPLTPQPGKEDEVHYGQLTWSDGNSAKSYSNQLPFQRVRHTKLVSDNMLRIGTGTLKAIVGYQQNYRREFEETTDEAELAMQLHTVNYDVRYQLSGIGKWNIATGLGGMWQKNVNEEEEMLIPDYHLFDVGYFVTAGRQLGQWHLSGGARIDNRHLSTKTADEDGVRRFDSLSRNFSGVTGSIGAVYNVNDNTNLRINIARGFRAPTVSELSSNGVHEGSVQYELGNSELKPEYSTQLDLGINHTSHNVSITASIFSNWINNYIFPSRLPYETEGYRTYKYTEGDANLLGCELAVDVHPINAMHIENAFSYVRGIQLHQTKNRRYLPMIPAPRWTSNIQYVFPSFANGHCQRTFVGLGMEYNFRQDHFYAFDETETATPDYALFNITAGTDLHVLGHNCIELSLMCLNIFDKVYQSHLSRLKYTDGPGISGMGRNICIKMNIPLDIHL